MLPYLLRLLAFQSDLNRTANRFCRPSFCLFHKRKLVNSSLLRILCGRVSFDFAFDCIPVANESCMCNVLQTFLPCAGDVIHPALRNRRVWERD